MGALINRIGIRYGSLIVLRKDDGNLNRLQVRWICRCDCGKEKSISGGKLSSGEQQSCGCKKGLVKHGENRVNKRTPEYRALANIIQRCKNPKHNAYPYYGGRGITVSEQWDSMEKYHNFLNHIGRKPTPKHTVDRIDTNGNYEPGNVKWATRAEQNRNLRRNIMVEFDGQRMCLEDASIKSGINRYTLRRRIMSGWPKEKLFSPPATKNLHAA